MQPFAYQNRRTTNYFEGWYLRFVNAEEDVNVAVIFALSKAAKDPHAFIQLFQSTDQACDYIRYPLHQFREDGELLWIADQYISPYEINVANNRIQIEGRFKNTIRIAKTMGSESAMSIVSYLPLNTAQEVIYMDGDFNGTLRVEGKTVTSAKLYIEKTYGHRFPPHHMWLQSNHFDVPEASFSFSVGILPILGLNIKGWFGIFRYGKDEYRFAIYNLAKLNIIKESATKVELEMTRGRFRLHVQASRDHWVNLVGPVDGALMEETVHESISAQLIISLYDRDELVVHTTATHAGMENTFTRP
jgi:tocopherol cyclase